MIYLKLKNGLELTFNLEKPENEKGLRDAWYAMSDMQAYQGKKLKITPDTGEHLTYTVGDIVECRYKPGKVEVDEDLEGKTTEFEMDKEVNRIINIILQVHGDLSAAEMNKVVDLVTTIVSEQGLKVEIDPMHKDFMEAVERAIKQPANRVEKHAADYLYKYRRKYPKRTK